MELLGSGIGGGTGTLLGGAGGTLVAPGVGTVGPVSLGLRRVQGSVRRLAVPSVARSEESSATCFAPREEVRALAVINVKTSGQ